MRMILEVHRNPHPRSSHQPAVQLQVQVDHSPRQPGQRSEVTGKLNKKLFMIKNPGINIYISVCVYVRWNRWTDLPQILIGLLF